MSDYENSATFFGALVGRVANRIANGTFTLNNVTYRLNINDGGSLPNHLHGGPQGWDKVSTLSFRTPRDRKLLHVLLIQYNNYYYGRWVFKGRVEGRSER